MSQTEQLLRAQLSDLENRRRYLESQLRAIEETKTAECCGN